MPKSLPRHVDRSHFHGARILLLILAWGLGIVGLQGQSFTIAPSPFQVVLDNSGKIVNNACVWTYLAGTTTPATTYADNLGTPNSNPIRSDSAGRFTAYLLAGSNYKFTYETSCTPPAHGTVLRTADNIAGTPSTSATVDVTGTAGETISAGQCAYLSDGSGAKTAGQWFKCDSGQPYSSVVPEIGLAPSAIVSAASGTIRIAGSVTGLSSLAVGSTYYAGSAGAITTTAPALSRNLGVADSASSIVLTPNPPRVPGAWMDDFRLTLSTGVPVTTADVTAATTIYASPYTGNRIDLPDANGNPVRHTSAEFSIAVPATTNQMYDVYAFDNAGAPTLELVAWTSDTSRSPAVQIARTNGRLLQVSSPTRLYLGSFRTTGVSGQTEDSLTKRYLWNYYNRVRRALHRHETTNGWTYTTATFRQANASTSNQVDVVVGVAEVMADLDISVNVSNSTGGINVTVALGEDSTTTPLTNIIGGDSQALTTNGQIRVSARREVAIGRHFYAWLEFSAATGTTTWGSQFNVFNSGINGSIEG